MEKKRKIRGDDPSLNDRKAGKGERRIEVCGVTYFWMITSNGIRIREPDGKSRTFTMKQFVGSETSTWPSWATTPFDVSQFIKERYRSCTPVR